MLEGFRREVTVSDLCRREGIKPHSYYSWTNKLMEAGKELLTRSTLRETTQPEVLQLKRKNGGLKQLVKVVPGVVPAEKTVIPTLHNATGAKR